MVEDQVDAVVCAYVALFADARAGAHHDVRRLRDRLHRHARPCPTDLHADAARAADRPGTSDPGGSAVREYAELHPELRLAADAVRAAGDLDPRRRRHQLPQRHRPGEVASRRSRPRPPAPSTASRSFTDPLREITDQIGVRVITYVHSDVAGGRRPARRPGRRPRRPRHGPGDGERGPVRLRQPAPARRPGRRRARTSRRTSRCAAAARRSRSARCCSTRGRSSSTTSATRARSPTSTRPTSTAGSRWPPGCSSSPTASSPRSATGSRTG